MAVVLAAQAAWSFLAPRLAIAPVLGFVIVFAMVVASVIGVGAFAPCTRRSALGIPLAAGLLLATLAFYPLAGHPRTVAGIVTLLLLAGGTQLGAAIGGRIQHPGHLMIVAYVSSLADLYSVFSASGVSHTVVESEVVLSVVAVPWAMPGTEDIVPVLGVGDIALTALYLSAARRHAIPRNRVIALLALGYVVTMLAVVALARPLPALPALGLAMFLGCPEIRSLRKEDRRTAFIGIGVLTLLAIAAFSTR